LLSAIAIPAEHPDYVGALFRHPLDWAGTAEEEQLGACRVLLDMSGLWRSTLVDTYLPVLGGPARFAKPAGDPCEIWF